MGWLPPWCPNLSLNVGEPSAVPSICMPHHLVRAAPTPCEGCGGVQGDQGLATSAVSASSQKRTCHMHRQRVARQGALQAGQASQEAAVPMICCSQRLYLLLLQAG